MSRRDENALRPSQCRTEHTEMTERVRDPSVLQGFYCSNPFKPSGVEWLHFKVFRSHD